jgi:hypothetical protein
MKTHVMTTFVYLSWGNSPFRRTNVVDCSLMGYSQASDCASACPLSATVLAETMIAESVVSINGPFSEPSDSLMIRALRDDK